MLTANENVCAKESNGRVYLRVEHCQPFSSVVQLPFFAICVPLFSFPLDSIFTSLFPHPLNSSHPFILRMTATSTTRPHHTYLLVQIPRIHRCNHLLSQLPFCARLSRPVQTTRVSHRSRLFISLPSRPFNVPGKRSRKDDIPNEHANAAPPPPRRTTPEDPSACPHNETRRTERVLDSRFPTWRFPIWRFPIWRFPLSSLGENGMGEGGGRGTCPNVTGAKKSGQVDGFVGGGSEDWIRS